MKKATLNQAQKILAIFKDTPSEQVQAILESGLLSDLLNANCSLRDGIDRNAIRGSLGLCAKAKNMYPHCFTDEEMESGYGYPQEFAVRPILEQLLKIAPLFPGLDQEPALKMYQQLPDISSFVPEVWAGREVRRWVNWYAVPRWEKVAKTHNDAVEKILDLIGNTRTLYNYHKGNLGPKYLRTSERTAVALQMLGEKQRGDFLLIPAQFGLTHRGRSMRRVRVVYMPNEFGLGSFIAGCMILSHPERLVEWDQLHINCPGDEYSPVGVGVFSHAPIFNFSDGEVVFNAGWVDGTDESFGSASGFLPR